MDNRYINHFFESKLLKGAVAVLGATGLDALCRLGVVFILVHYYSKELFGVWAAITSVAAIIVTGDLGITNALRNKVSQLLVEDKNDRSSQTYFYSVFYFFLFLAIVLTIILFCIFPYVPYEMLFKTDDTVLQSVGMRILIFVQVVFFFTIPFSIGSTLYFTYQESHISAWLISSQAIAILFLVFILSLCNVSIFVISITYFLVSLVSSIAGTVYFIVRHKWFNYKVTWKEGYRCNIELIKIGVKFMALQLSSSFLQNAGTIIASSALGVRLAADYSMYTKLYTLGISIFQSVFNPLWGSYAAAIYKKDFVWVKKTYRNSLSVISIIFLSFAALMCMCGNFFLKIIAGNEYHTTSIMYLALGVNALFFMLFNAATIIPKAYNRITLLVFISLLACVSITPISNFLLSILGIYGLPIATSILWISLYIIMHLQSTNIIKKG